MLEKVLLLVLLPFAQSTKQIVLHHTVQPSTISREAFQTWSQPMNCWIPKTYAIREKAILKTACIFALVYFDHEWPFPK